VAQFIWKRENSIGKHAATMNWFTFRRC
jgi:hypothetical protein